MPLFKTTDAELIHTAGLDALVSQQAPKFKSQLSQHKLSL